MVKLKGMNQEDQFLYLTTVLLLLLVHLEMMEPHQTQVMYVYINTRIIVGQN